jgi:predicted N-acetyltransferase YhbS
VDPAFQGRGAGAQLVADGVARAHAQGLPVFVAGSKKGTRLYERLGFVVKETPDITSAKVPLSILMKEVPAATEGA